MPSSTSHSSSGVPWKTVQLLGAAVVTWVLGALYMVRLNPEVVFFHHCAFSTCSSWSQARYRDYAFVALDVDPAPPGYASTMPLSAINEQGVEFDRVVFSRTARAT